MRVALIHEWLAKPGGSEQVLARLTRLFPNAPVFPLVWTRGLECEYGIDPARIRPAWTDRLPFARTRYPWLLPLFPGAVERHDLAEFDLVIANHHCVAHGVRPRAGVPLISHIHTPMRYAWDLREDYLRGSPLGDGMLGDTVRARLDALREWDRAAAQRVTAFLPSSENCAGRVRRNYGREPGAVIHPPVDLARFRTGAGAKRGSHFLAVSRLVRYKRIDDAIALAAPGGALELRIAGTGAALEDLRRLALGRPVQFLGRIDDAALVREYRTARALLCPGEEDFGLTAVEALAAGCPVIHRGSGGFREIAELVLGELGARLTLDRLRPGENPSDLAADLDEATARLVEPATQSRLDELFAPERFDAQFRAQVIAIAGADAEKAMIK